MSSYDNLTITIDNLKTSIDMYNSLIIITDDINLNLIYIDCLLKLEDNLNSIFIYLRKNKQKHPKEYLKYFLNEL
jgi:hypothetical protein